MFASERAERQIQPMRNKLKTLTSRTTSGWGMFGSDTTPLEPRWSWLIAALGVATLSLAFPALGGAFLVSAHSDQYIAGYGFRSFAAQSLRAGNGFPQWNPYMFGGLPYVAAMHGDIFYPTFLLRLIMRTDLAMTWGFVIHTFLAGAFTLGFLRASGLSRWPAVFGALAYLLCGPIASYPSPGHDGKLFVSALLPLALWMLTRAIISGRLWAWGVFALAVGLAVLSPHPQLLQYFLLVCGAYALFLVWRETPIAGARQTPLGDARLSPSAADETAPAELPFRTRMSFAVSRLTVALGMVVIGLGLGAIQYWPVLGYVNSSPRANGREYAFASTYSLPPEELLNTYLPQFSGILNAYWGRNQIHLHSEYLGVVLLMLVPLAFGAGSRKLFARFWLAAAGVALLWALGGFTPFFKLIYAVVPGTKYFRAPSTIIYVLAFSLCVLSALGLERLMARHVSARFLKQYLIGWASFGVLVAVLAWSGILTDFAKTLGDGFARGFGHDPDGFRAFVDRNAIATKLGAARSFAVVLATAALMFAFNSKKLQSAAFAMGIVLLSSVDQWSIAHKYWLFSKPARFLYGNDQIIDFLKAETQPGRVFVYTKTADYRAAIDPYFGTRGFGEGAGFMVHGIRSVSGYQGNVLARFEAMSADNAMTNPAFWRHENVRWLYTNLEIADTTLKRIGGPLENSAGSRAYLYAMPGENPYAWVAASFGAQDDSSAVREILDGAHDPRVFAAFDSASVLNGRRVAQPPAILPPPSTITNTVTDFGPGRATIELSAPAHAGSALVISENYYKGWRAVADGKEVPVVRAAFNLIGVPLPEGARVITFTFQDERYATGRLVTLLSLLASFALFTPAVIARFRNRRRRRLA